MSSLSVTVLGFLLSVAYCYADPPDLTTNTTTIWSLVLKLEAYT